MRISTISVILVLFFSGFFYTIPDRASALVIPFCLYPEEDKIVQPAATYPGTWNVGWFCYDHGYEDFSHELRINNTNYPLLFMRIGGATTWGNIEFELDDVPASYDEYFYFSVSLYVRKGSNTFGYWFGLLDNYHQTGDLEYVYNANGHVSYPTNPTTGFPWTLEEINALTGNIVIKATDEPQKSWVCFEVTVTPVEYDYEADFITILRPDGDKSGPTYPPIEWEKKSEDNYYEEVNETVQDGSGSYIYDDNAIAGSDMVFSLSDMPLWASKTSAYTIEICVFGWHNYTNPDACGLTISPYSISTLEDYEWGGQFPDSYPFLTWFVQPYNSNMTGTLDVSPYSSSGWTWYELNNLELFIGTIRFSLDVYWVHITQIFVIVTVGEYYYFSPVDETFYDNFNGVVWVLVVFLPGLALEEYVPMGFAFGTILMLGIMTVVHVSFLPVLLVGLVALGAALYRGI